MTYRHPELIPPLITTILDLGLNYTRRINEHENSIKEQEDLKERRLLSFGWEADLNEEQNNDDELLQLTAEIKADIAAMLLRRIEVQWAPVATGVSTLDDLLGSKHGILQEEEDGNLGGGGGGAAGGISGLRSIGGCLRDTL